MSNNKKGLGRGLESLFGFYDDISNEKITNDAPIKENKSVQIKTNTVTEMDINKIFPNPNQPRKHFDE